MIKMLLCLGACLLLGACRNMNPLNPPPTGDIYNLVANLPSYYYHDENRQKFVNRVYAGMDAGVKSNAFPTLVLPASRSVARREFTYDPKREILNVKVSCREAPGYYYDSWMVERNEWRLFRRRAATPY